MHGDNADIQAGIQAATVTGLLVTAHTETATAMAEIIIEDLRVEIELQAAIMAEVLA